MARWLAVAALVLGGTALYAQDRRSGEILGQTQDTGSLPIFAKASESAQQELGKVARSAERAVFLVGVPKFGSGTAWVVSKKHRLLVTNAHVADIRSHAGKPLIAIPSGTGQIYRVEKVWYHPGVRRFLPGAGGLSVRSSDPKDGRVDSNSPDLAMLQLSSEGPELEVEFAPATRTELANLFAQPAAILGFPGHDTSGFPQLGENAAATYHDGVISRITDFELRASANPADLQYLQYTMSTWSGFSGSPVFLPSGRVAAVHNAAHKKQNEQSGEVKFIPHGVRVDCVLEMLVHYDLAEKVPFVIDKNALSIERWTKPDARTEQNRANFAKARGLVSEAIFSKNRKEFLKGVELCDQAIEAVPTYAAAYSWRAAIRHLYWLNNNFNKQQAIQILGEALRDAKIANTLAPDVEEVMQVCRVANAIAWETRDAKTYQDSIRVMTDLLSGESLQTPRLRAEAFAIRANAYDNIDEDDASIRDYTEAIRLNPESASHLESRAEVYQSNGYGGHAAADYAKAKKLRMGDIQVEWKGIWYPATLLKTEGERYFIHYIGYDASWDEWVTKERIKFRNQGAGTTR